MSRPNLLPLPPPQPDPPPPSTEAPAAGPPVEALLVDIRGLSVMLSRSVASLHRDDAAGRLPAGLRLGGSKRWRKSEITEWVAAGMPDRRTWTAMREAAAQRGRGR